MRAVLRNGVVARAEGAAVRIVDRHGARAIEAPWRVGRVELSVDGRYVLGFCDEMRRARVWDVTRGIVVHEAAGRERVHSLHGGLVRVDGVPYAFLAVMDGRLTITDLREGRERGWLSVSGYNVLEVLRIDEVADNWLALTYHLYSEYSDSVMVASAAAALTDPMVLQETHRFGGITEYAQRVAAGPAGPGHVVTFRDAEADSDDPFGGFQVWDLHRRTVVVRVPYEGAVPDNGTISAGARTIAIEVPGGVDLLDRASGAVEHRAGALLDPHRFELGRVEGARLEISGAK